jgi:chemotaxis protein CheC
MRLTADQEDAFKELINVGVGRAAAALSDLIGMRIELEVPRLALCRPDEMAALLPAGTDASGLLIAQEFRGEWSGQAALLFPRECGLHLARLLADVDGPTDELDLELSGILTEVGNIVLNGVLGSLANALDTPMEYSVPHLCGERSAGAYLGRATSRRGERPYLLVADARFQVEERAISGSLLLVLELNALRAVLACLGRLGVA